LLEDIHLSVEIEHAICIYVLLEMHAGALR